MTAADADNAEAPYDLVILGGGPGGGAAAGQIARRGGRACMVERGHLGGVCLNVGCMPSKAMLAASDIAWRMRTCGPLGIEPGAGKPDGPAFMKRVADVVATLRQRAEGRGESNPRIDVVRGAGRAVDARTIEVLTPEGPRRVTGRALLIATGASAGRPGEMPWHSDRVMTTDEALTARDLPASVLVVGGGVIGCEMACIYAELGIPVTLVEMLDGLLSTFEPEAGQAVAAALAERGVKVLTGCKVAEMTADDSAVVAVLDDGQRIETDRALVAVGRRPNVAGIGLEEIGVRVDGGIIPVDDRCRTNVEGVYAVGDVAERNQYAHLAERMGVVAAENVMGFDLADDRTVVPRGVYTHPEVAVVGVSFDQARTSFPAAKVFRYSLASSGTALAYGQMEGQLKVVADGETGRIHGALWIGPHAVDMIQEFSLAMRHGLTMEDLHHTIHPHPSFQEAASVVADAWVSQKRRKQR